MSSREVAIKVMERLRPEYLGLAWETLREKHIKEVEDIINENILINSNTNNSNPTG